MLRLLATNSHRLCLKRRNSTLRLSHWGCYLRLSLLSWSTAWMLEWASLPRRVSFELGRTLYWVPLPASPFAKPNQPRIPGPNIKLVNLNILRNQTSVLRKLSPRVSVSPHLRSSHQVYKCASSSKDLHPFPSYASNLRTEVVNNARKAVQMYREEQKSPYFSN